MKKNIITTTIWALLIVAQIQFADAATLKITVEGIEKAEGKVLIGLYNTEDGWLKKEMKGETLDASIPEVIWEIPDLQEGEYAVSTYHDADSDGELNTGAFGIPSEPYGFSNNARGMFGPAKWKNAKFVVKAGENEIRIRVH